MLQKKMASIPVPVHFDGHNINIITEDSPSTCKNRTKGMNYGKKNNNKNRKRNNNQNGKYGKTQLLNKRQPNANSKVKSATSVTSTNATTDGMGAASATNQQCQTLQPSNKENMNASIPGTKTKTSLPPHPPPVRCNSSNTVLPSSSPLPLAPKAIENRPLPLPIPNNMNYPIVMNMKHENGKSLIPPLPPPPLPNMLNNRNNSNMNVGGVRMHNLSVSHAQSQSHGPGHHAMHKRNRLPLSAAEQNNQLIAGGLDPNEFGSHDDIGFDDDDSQNNGGGNNGKDRQNLYKTELCREWSTSGWCYYNKRCSFAHGLQELRPVFRSKKWRTKRCRNWHTTGYCPYEHRCQFLHDQSPPRRISDYATANARALVAAQQRMQPLYFHYQVDCNRDESSGEDDDFDKKNGKSAKPDSGKPVLQSPHTAHTPSIGPRLKRKANRNNKVPLLQNNNHMHNSNMHGNLNANNQNVHQPQFPAALRMVRQRKNDKNVLHAKKMNHSGNLKKNKPKTPRSGLNNPNMNHNNKPFQIRKKKAKDAVITPFNPGSVTYGGGGGVLSKQSYEIAAQQLGLYNPSQPLTLPNIGLGVGALPNMMPTIPSLGALPPLPMTNINHINTTFQALPPSIDPSLYLSLTPSPPQSPRGVNIHGNAVVNKKHKMDVNANTNGNNLTVDVPVSLTPSPPSLAAAPTTNNSNGMVPQLDLAQMSQMSQQQVQLQLAKQQQTLQVLHAKVQEVAQQQAAQHAEQQATVQALLARNVGNKSATPIAPIDGAMLESLLPSDEIAIHKDAALTNLGLKSGFNLKSIKADVVAGINSLSGMKKENNVGGSANLPPIPPIPPPLQLQTSINSVVTGAVAAAINATPTPTAGLATSGGAGTGGAGAGKATFGYPSAANDNATATALKQIQNVVPATAAAAASVATPTVYDMHAAPSYAQQAHAHAHAYASAHTAHSGAMPYSYPGGMSYPQQYGHNAQPLQLQPLQPQIGYPPFYAPSPDFQELSVPQQQYYGNNYSQHRHY